MQIAFEVFFAIAIQIVSVVGNLLVVYAIHRRPRLNTVTNMLIENLAWTDICMAAFHMPFWIVSLWSGRLLFDHLICQIAGSTLLLFGTASLNTLAIIAMNRYLKVVKNHIYAKLFGGRRIARLCCVLTWIVAAFFTTPPLYGWGAVKFSEKFTDCVLAWELKYISYIAVLLTIAFLLPTAMIFYAYFQVYRRVQASATQLKSHATQQSIPNQNLKGIAHKTEHRVLLTSFIVVCVYLCCWTPVCVVGLSEVFGWEQTRAFHMVAINLMFSSCLSNPIIYGLLNPQFKQAFKKIFHLGPSNSDNSVGFIVTNSRVVATLPAWNPGHRSQRYKGDD